jgi:hypothetical protein
MTAIAIEPSFTELELDECELWQFFERLSELNGLTATVEGACYIHALLKSLGESYDVCAAQAV